MLSTGAFNALLKTLEEPPEHVKFILATTEPQKLPATILSRCQRFDFKRISNENIIKRLKIVCKESNIEITDEALNVKCDIAMVPVGGTYTMTADEAANLTEIIKPSLGIPIHYKTIVGSVEDAISFKELLKDSVKVEILMN